MHITSQHLLYLVNSYYSPDVYHFHLFSVTPELLTEAKRTPKLQGKPWKKWELVCETGERHV